MILKQKRNRKAICLLSGGMDSYVAAALTRQEGYTLYGLSFYYGQKNRKELLAAKKIAAWLKMKKHWVLNLPLPKAASSLTDPGKKIPHRTVTGIASTYVPARNTIFLSYALAYAETCQAQAIVIGVNAVDYSGYPDCRPEYIRQFQNLINVALKTTIQGKSVLLKAPLLFLSKAEIVKKGICLGLDFALSWSCYHSGSKPCGVCPSCRLREKGFREACLVDPLSRGK